MKVKQCAVVLRSLMAILSGGPSLAALHSGSALLVVGSVRNGCERDTLFRAGVAPMSVSVSGSVARLILLLTACAVESSRDPDVAKQSHDTFLDILSNLNAIHSAYDTF